MGSFRRALQHSVIPIVLAVGLQPVVADQNDREDRLEAITVTASSRTGYQTGLARPQHLIRSANVWFHARVVHSDHPEPAQTYRLYDEPAQIVLLLTIAHASLENATANQDTFARALRISMRGHDAEPIAIDSEGVFRQVGESGRSVALPSTEPLRISSGHEIEWELRLRRQDGRRFSTGLYMIHVSLAGAFSTLRLDDGSAPRSRSSHTTLTIQSRPPTTARERGRMHNLAAQEAMQERRYSEAAAAAQRALNADPSNASTYFALAVALLRLNRCREAAAALENLFEVSLHGESPVPEVLAQAYACAGDDLNARRVLRRRGIREHDLDAELRRVRERLDRWRNP